MGWTHCSGSGIFLISGISCVYIEIWRPKLVTPLIPTIDIFSALRSLIFTLISVSALIPGLDSSLFLFLIWHRLWFPRLILPRIQAPQSWSLLCYTNRYDPPSARSALIPVLIYDKFLARFYPFFDISFNLWHDALEYGLIPDLTLALISYLIWVSSDLCSQYHYTSWKILVLSMVRSRIRVMDIIATSRW